MIDAVIGFAAGALVGAATGIPLGVVNLAVVEAATRTGSRHAAAIGVGGALADGIHAALAFAGIAPLVIGNPAARRTLIVVSALIVIGYALAILRRRAAPPAEIPASRWRAIATGLTLTLPNPAPLAAWVAVGDVIVPGATRFVGLAAAAGVAIGSALWFTLLARLAATNALAGRVGRWMPRVVAVGLFAMVGFAVARELA